MNFSSCILCYKRSCTLLNRNGKPQSVKHSHPTGNYDNDQRCQPIRRGLSSFPLPPSWNSTRSLSSLHQSRKRSNSFCPPQRRYERLTKHTGAGGSPGSGGVRRRLGWQPPRSKDGRGDVEEAEVQTQPDGEVACGHRGWAPGSGVRHHPGPRPGSPGYNGGWVLEINSIYRIKMHRQKKKEEA